MTQEDALLKTLCEQASHEQDPKKLLDLTAQINDLLRCKPRVDDKLTESKKIA
jgi:hypothetical protein